MDARSSAFSSLGLLEAPRRRATASLPAFPLEGVYAAEFRHAADMQPHIAAWRALAERAAEPNVFAEPDFLLPAIQHLPEGRHVSLLLVWQKTGDELILRGLFPVLAPRLPFAPGKMRSWRPALAATGVPLLDREASGAIIEAALAHLAHRGANLGGILFSQAPTEGPFMLALKGAASRTRRHWTTFDLITRAILRGRHTTESGTDIVRQNTFAPLRRQGRELAEQGEVRLESAREPRAVRDAIEEFLVLEARGPKGRAGTALVSDPATASVFRTATRQFAHRRRCRVDVLRLDARAIAAAIVIESGRHAWIWMIAADESLAGFSPELLLSLDVTRAQLGRKRCDLTHSCAPGDHPAIDGLWQERIAVADILVAVRPGPSTGASIVRATEQARRRVRQFAQEAHARLQGMPSRRP